MPEVSQNLGGFTNFPSPSIGLSDSAPLSEVTTARSGAMDLAARSDHAHPRLTSSTRVVLVNGVGTVTYTRSFPSKPAIVLTAINPSGKAVQLEVTSDTMTGGVYTGCMIKGYRSQVLPALTGIALLTGLISALNSFDVLAGNADGVEVSVVAIMPSN